MKTFITTFAILLLFTVGCTDQTSVTSPINDQTSNNNSVLGKSRRTTESTLLTVGSSNSVSKEIDGDKGGLIYIGNYSGALEGQSVYGSIYFPAGSFSGTKTITMTLDPAKLTGTFGPSMEFNKPVSFSVLFTGLNLKKGDFTFVYDGPNGEQTEITSSYLYVDKDKGVLGILNAQIPHFSRYAFLR